MIKYIFSALVVIILAAACTQSADPDTLEGKKALLKEKNAQLLTLQKDIDQLKTDIEAEEPTKEKAPVNVTTLEVQKDVFRRFVDLQGIVSTDAVANASSEMGGRIVRLMVKEGQWVKKGQIIASTDAESIDKQKEEIQKGLDLAIDVYERQKRLWEQKIGSEVQYLQAKNNKERLEKSLQTIEVQSRKRMVYAPISGTVDRVITKEGELAGPGVPIVSIINTKSLKVVSDVPESYIGKVKVGDKVDVLFPALNEEMSLRVDLIGSTVDPSNRTFKLEMNIGKPSAHMKPNLLTVVKIKDLEIKEAVILPVDIIQQEVSGDKYVYTIDNSTEDKPVAKKIYIKTGESANNRIVITEGLQGGEMVIAKGARNVVENQPLILE
jgi:RND family efflux transporter MFP subunit